MKDIRRDEKEIKKTEGFSEEFSDEEYERRRKMRKKRMEL